MEQQDKKTEIFISAEGYFAELVKEGMEFRKINADPNIEIYLISLLNHYLDARNLFACVVAFGIGDVGVFDALCINDQKARHGAACLSGTGHANLIFLMPAPAR